MPPFHIYLDFPDVHSPPCHLSGCANCERLMGRAFPHAVLEPSRYFWGGVGFFMSGIFLYWYSAKAFTDGYAISLKTYNWQNGFGFGGGQSFAPCTCAPLSCRTSMMQRSKHSLIGKHAAPRAGTSPPC